MLVGVTGLLMVMNTRASLFDKKDVRVENRAPQQELAQYAPKAIPCGSNAPTAWRFRQDKMLPFFRKQVIVPFKASAEASQPWAPEALQLLEAVCDGMCEMVFPEQNQAWKKADALVKKGCTNSVIRWMQVIGFHLAKQSTQAVEALNKLDADLANTSDQWFAKLLVAIGYRTVNPSPKNKVLFVTRVAEWVQKGGLTKDDSRYVLELLTNLKNDGDRGVLEAFEKISSIDPWLTLMLRGEVVRKEAWEMRGNGWASTVTDEGSKGFSEGLALARKSFEEAWQLHPEFPNAATKMIEVCGCSGGDMRLWFDRAIAIELDRPLPYEIYAWYSRPRWGGSHQEMADFAEACYQTQRHDTRVPLFYAIIMFQITDDLKCDPKEVFTRPGVHKKCVEVLEPQTKNTNVPQAVCDLATELLPLVEYLGGDLKKAIEYNKRRKAIHPTFARTYLPNGNMSIYYVLNGLKWQHSKSLVPAEKLYQAGRYEEALAVFKNLNATNTMTGMELDYLVYRTHCTENQTLFKQGKWVTPTFNSLWSGWLNYGGSWGFDGKGFRTDREKSPLEWMPPVPEDVEYEGLFRFLAQAGQDSKVCFQLDKSWERCTPSILFSYENNKCQVAIGGKYDEPDTEPISFTCEKPEVRFRIVSCKNKVSVWVNGKQLIDGHDMTDYMRSFRKDGMRYLFLYGTRVAISDLRMRAPDVTKK